jgi:general secretion pathway protein A
MYAQFFGLKQEPFSIAPDPRYLFMSERHREALAHLLYGVKGGGGFVLLTGEIGAGKTTVCRCFLEKIPKRCNVAYIFNPKLTVTELLKSVCDEFCIPYQHQGPGAPTIKDYLDPLNEFLLRTHAVGQNNVLVIDEAQNLSADVLEQLRLLTNLETSERKLLQIILIGQPELREMLARPELEQLAQRVIARFHLEALSEAETLQYVRHRLSVAGMGKAIPFDRKAVRRIHQLARGVPRRINLLCDRAMLGAYAKGQPSIGTGIVEQAAREVFDRPVGLRNPWSPQRMTLAAVGLAAGVGLLGVVGWAWDGALHRKPAEAKGAALPASKPALARAASAASASSALAAAAPHAVASAFDAKAALRDEKQAWRELAAQWHVALDDGDPCDAAQRQQVHCFKRPNVTLAQIRLLARPGILTLHDEADRPVYALLTGLGEHSATLQMGGIAQTLSLPALAAMWRGDFATFWRAPPGYLKRIGDGDTGPAADWLAAQLARLPGAGGDAQPLKSKIYAFQLAQGLEADGRAGPMTFMQLNRAAGVDEPRLRTGS